MLCVIPFTELLTCYALREVHYIHDLFIYLIFTSLNTQLSIDPMLVIHGHMLTFHPSDSKKESFTKVSVIEKNQNK